MSATAAAATALTIYLLGLGAAFGWQTWRHWRTTGSTGYRGISGRPGSLHWWGGVLFALAVLLGAAAPILALADITSIPVGLRHPALPGTGLAIALAGIAVTLAAQRQMGASWRIGVDTGERTTLITGGLFAHVRNPIFTGMLAVTTGLAGMVPTIISALALAGLLAAVQIQVRAVEEPYLLTAHSTTYRNYAARAGRFLPGIGRLAPADQPTHPAARDQRRAPPKATKG